MVVLTVTTKYRSWQIGFSVVDRCVDLLHNLVHRLHLDLSVIDLNYSITGGVYGTKIRFITPRPVNSR